MLPFSANIAFLFADRPFLARIAAAAQAEFPAVECHFPYDTPAETIRAALNQAGSRMIALNTAPGDLAAGEFGLACVPSRQRQFRDSLHEALRYARILETPFVHVLAGVIAESSEAVALETLTTNLAEASEAASRQGTTLLIEPLNLRDRPGYALSRSDQAAEIIRRVQSPNLKMMFDIYHIQIMEGDITRRLERHLDVIGHVQIAGVPSRAEPDDSELSLPHFFRTLERLGYRGHVGCEYKPRGRTEEGLAWRKRLSAGS